MKIFPFLIAFLPCFVGYSQNFIFDNNQFNSEYNFYANSANFKEEQNNMLKINFLILNLPGATLQYERKIWNKTSFGINLGYTKNQHFPFIKILTNKLENEPFVKNQLEKITFNNYSITPEIKFYFGKDIFKGFYISPFISFARYDIRFPLEIHNNEVESIIHHVNFSGNFNSTTFGLSVGSQWKISKNFYLDWLIVGPHLGGAKNHLYAKTKLTKTEQTAVKQSLELIKEGINSIEDLP